MATGTPVFVSDTIGSAKIRSISYTWTSTAGGVVITDSIHVDGWLQAVETAPDLGTPPTSYNLQVRRGGSTSAFYDLLAGGGALRSVSLPERAFPKDANGNAIIAPTRNDNVFVTIDTAGASKLGSFTLYFIQ